MSFPETNVGSWLAGLKLPEGQQHQVPGGGVTGMFPLVGVLDGGGVRGGASEVPAPLILW